MRPLGIVGAKRAGKDTLSSVLCTELGFTRLAFADALKALAYDLDPVLWTDDGEPTLAQLVDCDGWERAKEHDAVRTLLQRLGVAVREHVHADAWVQPIARVLDTWPDRPYVITDVRFDNEVEAIRSRGGLIVRVRRPEVEAASIADTHVSERLWQIVEPDVEVWNDGTIDDLRREVLGLTELGAIEVPNAAAEPIAAVLDSHGIGGKWARAASEGRVL